MGLFLLEGKMETNEIIALLTGKLPDPSESIFTFTMRDLITAIVRRTGDSAIALTLNDLLLAREELLAVISHYMDEVVNMGLDAWEISREGGQSE
jgi:hypothetical protein